VRAATNDAAAARQRIATGAARAYYRAAAAQVSATVAQDLIGWLDTLVAYNKVRVAEGVAAEADLLRSELERDRAMAEASLVEADLRRARADLASFLGDGTLPDGIRVDIDDRPLRIPAGMGDVRATPAQTATVTGRLTGDAASAAPATDAVVRRPDVVALRARLDAAGAAVAVERSMLVRQVGAIFGAKRAAGTTSMVAGVSIPFPIFDQNRGEIARAAAERDAVQYALAAQERSARTEIAGADNAARVLTERTELLVGGAAAGVVGGGPAYLAKANELRRLVLGAYQEGGVPLLQVLDAARVWADSRATFYTTLFAQHEAVIALVVAQGTDLFDAMPALVGIDTNGRPPRPALNQ
jgi:cobalt-zinc-cadmium efflux system outer membrane protein